MKVFLQMTKVPEAGPVARHRNNMDEPRQMRFWTGKKRG